MLTAPRSLAQIIRAISIAEQIHSDNSIIQKDLKPLDKSDYLKLFTYPRIQDIWTGLWFRQRRGSSSTGSHYIHDIFAQSQHFVTQVFHFFCKTTLSNLIFLARLCNFIKNSLLKFDKKQIRTLKNLRQIPLRFSSRMASSNPRRYYFTANCRTQRIE